MKDNGNRQYKNELRLIANFRRLPPAGKLAFLHRLLFRSSQEPDDREWWLITPTGDKYRL